MAKGRFIKIISWALILILAANILFLALGKLNWIVFWLVIAVIWAAVKFGLPRINGVN